MYVQSLILNPFVFSRQASSMKKKQWLWGDNSVKNRLLDYGSCVLPFLSLPSIYKPSFISIPFVLSKMWPE